MKKVGEEKRSRGWASMAGFIGFIGIGLAGLAFMPGMINPKPTPIPAADEAPMIPSAFKRIPTVRADSTIGNVAVHSPSAEALSTYSFDCMISANETVEIGSSILGVIESIYVERSAYVEAGQVLATLESSVEEAAVRIAEARAERTVELESTEVSLWLGKKRSRRAHDLYEEESMSLDLRDEIDTEAQLAKLAVKEARENHRLAKLQLEQATALLNRRSIRSPVNGYVVERVMSPGEVVDDETILTIAEIDPLRVEVILPTLLFGSISPGDSFEIIPEPPLDQRRTAEVHIVDRVLDAASGTFGVRLLLPNPNHDLPGGLRCQARLLSDGPESG